MEGLGGEGVRVRGRFDQTHYIHMKLSNNRKNEFDKKKLKNLFSRVFMIGILAIIKFG